MLCNLQSAVAGLNSPAEVAVLGACPRISGVDGWTLRNKTLRTRSGPEGSSSKQAILCAAEFSNLSKLSG